MTNVESARIALRTRTLDMIEIHSLYLGWRNFLLASRADLVERRLDFREIDFAAAGHGSTDISPPRCPQRRPLLCILQRAT